MNKIRILKEQIKELKQLIVLKDKRIQELTTGNFNIQYPQTIMNPIVYHSKPEQIINPSPYTVISSGSNFSSFENGNVFTTGQWEPSKN